MLTAAQIQHLEAAAKPYKKKDSRGLYLLVMPNGAKLWRVRFRRDGRENSLSLGKFPGVSLAEARRERDKLRKLLADGVDIVGYMKAVRRMKRAQYAREQAALRSSDWAGVRMALYSDGSFTFWFGERAVALTADETQQLRAFLDRTREVKAKEELCH